METKGLSVEVYRHSSADCTAGGISATKTTLILVSEESSGVVFKMPEIFSGDETNSVKIVKGNLPGYAKAIPVKPKENGMVGPMFGGNFIYSSDSRFPFKYPVPIHDRYETQEMYDTLSR